MALKFDQSRYLAGLRRVRSLYTALLDSHGSTDGQRVDYNRYLRILDQQIATAEMRLSACGFAREVRLQLS